MADQKYELLIVIRSQLELEEFRTAIAKVRAELGSLDKVGADAFGSQSKAAQGAKALTGIQTVLAQASAKTGESMHQEGQHTADLADVLRILSTATRGGSDAKRAFGAISRVASNDTLREISASRDFITTQTLLARALGVTGKSTELFQSAMKEIPGAMAQGTAAIRIAEAAESELNKRRSAATGIIAAVMYAERQQKLGITESASAFKVLSAAQAETARTMESLTAGSKSSAAARKAFIAVSGSTADAILEEIIAAKNYEGVIAGVGKAVGLSSEATKVLGGASTTVVGQMAQATNGARIQAVAQKQLAANHQATSDQISAFGKRLRDTIADQRAADDATKVGSANLKGLASTAASAGATMARLTTGGGMFLSTFGRAVAAGSTQAAQGLTTVTRAEQAVIDANSVFEAVSKRAAEAGLKQGSAAVLAAARIRDQAVATAQAEAAAASMSTTIGFATAATAGIVVTAIAGGAALKSLTTAALEASKAFDIVALRSPKEALAGLRALVFELSAKTGQTFEDLAEAEGRALLKVGGDAEKSALLLKVASDTALAAFIAPAQAVEALGDQLRNYGLEVGRVKDVSNALLVLQKVAKEDFNALAGGLGTVTPVAKELGIDFQELTASVAGMSAAGLSAQQAIFGLRTDLANIANPTSAISKEMRLLGVDTSEIAFRTKGLVPVLRDMDAALRRNGTSLGAFFGESRKSGPIFALLGEGGKKASEALAEMKSGADQTKDAIERLNTPLREIRNALVELQNLLPKVGDAFLNSFAPAVVQSIGLLKDLNFYLEELNKKSPATAEAVAQIGHQLLLQIPVIGKFISYAGLAGNGLDVLRKSLRTLADEAGLLPRKAFGPVNDLFLAVAHGAVDAAIAYAKLTVQLGQKPATGFLADTFKGFAEGAAMAAQAVPGLLHALDELPAIAERASHGLADVLKNTDIDKVVKEQLDKLKTTGNTVEGFRALTKVIADNGDAQGIAAGFARLYQRESEKTSRALVVQIALFETFSVALRLNHANIEALSSAMARFAAEQSLVIAGQELQEKATDGARQGLQGLASEYGLAGDKSLQLQNELKGEYEAYAKRNALLDLSGKTTSAATKSIQELIDEEKLVAKAFDDTRTAVLDFHIAEKTTLENFEIQLKRVRDRADAFEVLSKKFRAFGVNFAPITKEMRKWADAYEKFIVEPLRRGFSGGLEKDLKAFARETQGSFKGGQDSAQKLIANYQDIVRATKDWKDSQRSTTDNLIGQAEKAKQLESRVRALGPAFEEAANRIHDAAVEFDKLVVSSRSFSGGFDAKIREFSNAAGDVFNVGGEEADKLITAYGNIKSSLIQFKAEHRTVIENLTLEVERAHQLEAALRRAGETGLADKIRQAADEFERLEIKPREGGFSAGFSDGIQKFVLEAKNGFEIGGQAAQQFASDSVDSIQGFLRSIGRGKAGVKEFGIALLEAIDQMIAKMIALQIASSIFGALFGGFGGGRSQTIDLGNGGGVGAGLPPRAQGGPVERRKRYLVGEKGPELFVSEEKGQIIPFAKTMLALGSPAAGSSLGLGSGPNRSATIATPGGRGVVGLAGRSMARARDLPGPVSLLLRGEKGQGPRAPGFAAGGAHPVEMVASRGRDWTSEEKPRAPRRSVPTAYVSGGIDPRLLVAVPWTPGRAAPRQEEGAPRLRLVTESSGAQVKASDSVAEGFLKLVRRGRGVVGSDDVFGIRARAGERQRATGVKDVVQGLAKVAASIAMAVLPMAAAVGPVRHSSAAPASAGATPSGAKGHAASQIAGILTRAHAFADGGIEHGQDLKRARGGAPHGALRGTARGAGQGTNHGGVPGQVGSVLERWTGIAKTMSAHELAMGGVATQPSMTIFAERGKAEAFVPPPGPHRGIPVEFKNSSSGMRSEPQEVHIHVGGITLVATSLDPRRSADLILEHMPKIERAIADSLDNGRRSELVAAVRRVRG